MLNVTTGLHNANYFCIMPRQLPARKALVGIKQTMETCKTEMRYNPFMLQG